MRSVALARYPITIKARCKCKDIGPAYCFRSRSNYPMFHSWDGATWSIDHIP